MEALKHFFRLLAAAIVAVIVVVLIGYGAKFYFFNGSGAFERMVTHTGVYAVCKPKGYPVVCFLDADSKDGGLFCLPLSQVGDQCQ